MVSEAVAVELRELRKTTLPLEPAQRSEWIGGELGLATARLAETANRSGVGRAVADILSSFKVGLESKHLQQLLRCASHRGSEIRTGLLAGVESDTLVPYPAFAWQWECCQAYPWSSRQHINTLEFLALMNYVRSKSNKKCLMHLRWVHVLDSKVITAVVSRGRSSSRQLNRCWRRLMPFILGLDIALQVVWTISQWQFSDNWSRAFRPPG